MRGHPHLNNLSHHAAYCLIGETRRNASGVITYRAAFTYDPAGNRLSQTVNGVTTHYTYNALDQLVTAGTAQYEYDGRGNLVRVTDGAEVTTYAWDAADRLVAVSRPPSAVQYTYDADGRRVQQVTTVNGLSSTVEFLWDETSPYGDVLLETDASGNTLAAYVLGGTELLSQARDGIIRYYLQDAQGSVRTLTGASGNVADAYAYTAFGETLSHNGASVNPYQYTGQQFDALSGLYYLRARYYAPALGRFLSRDVFPYGNPVELNRYAYAANNPVNALDPTGLSLAETAGRYHASVEQWRTMAPAYRWLALSLGYIVILNLLWVEAKAPTAALPFPGDVARDKVWDKVRDAALLTTLTYLWSRLLAAELDLTDINIRTRDQTQRTIVELGSGTLGLWARALKAMNPKARVIATEEGATCRLLQINLAGSGVEVVCDWNSPQLVGISDETWAVAPQPSLLVQEGQAGVRITKPGGLFFMVVSQTEVMERSDMEAILRGIDAGRPWEIVGTTLWRLGIPSEEYSHDEKVWFIYTVK